MDYQIIWTEPALADLETIVTHIAGDNPPAAGRVGDEIIAHVELLATFPHIGPHYPRGSKSGDREILCRSYRIFYRVFEDRQVVEVLTIWHGARQEPELPA
jgi:plasmid stabilization system protein ParE